MLVMVGLLCMKWWLQRVYFERDFLVVVFVGCVGLMGGLISGLIILVVILVYFYLWVEDDDDDVGEYGVDCGQYGVEGGDSYYVVDVVLVDGVEEVVFYFLLGED